MVNTYVSIDLEMSGLNEKEDKIIEIGAIKVVDGQIVDTLSTLINPECQLSDEIIKITGITQEEVDKAPKLTEVLEDLHAFLGKDVLLGHSVHSDYKFLKRNFVNNQMSFDRKGLDTLRMARVALPELESKRLPDLCKYFNIETKSHRALEDAKATHELYQIFIKKYADNIKKAEDLAWFWPKPLVYYVKKEQPATAKQKQRLQQIIDHYELKIDKNIDSMTRNQVSRLTDKLLAKYGRWDPS